MRQPFRTVRLSMSPTVVAVVLAALVSVAAGAGATASPAPTTAVPPGGAAATPADETGRAAARLPGRTAAVVQRELMLLVQGATVPVDASPVLCHPGAGGYPQYGIAAEEWYFGKKGCRLEYPPDPNAIVSTVSESGWKEWFFSRPEAVARLKALLGELQAMVSSGSLSLPERLMVQSTAWELSYGLKRIGKEDARLAPETEPVLRQVMRLIESTLFSTAELARFPATLGGLAERAGAPEIAPTIQQMLAHDPGIVEVWTPTELHADLLFGRFANRLFVTLAEEAERGRLRAYLRDAKTPYDDLRNLPLAFPGVRAILVLYFNALATDLTIVPTEQVAFWQEYTFSDKTSFDLSLDQMAERISFTTVACEYDLAAASQADGRHPDGLVCRKAEQNRMARRAFIDVKPLLVDDRVTSLRGHCLRCHRNQVATFDTHGRRHLEFSPPLERGGRDLLTPFYLERVEAKLKEWAGRSLPPPAENVR